MYVLPFLLVSLVGGRPFLAMHFMIPSIILVLSLERVVPLELLLLSPLSLGPLELGPSEEVLHGI